MRAHPPGTQLEQATSPRTNRDVEIAATHDFGKTKKGQMTSDVAGLVRRLLDEGRAKVAT